MSLLILEWCRTKLDAQLLRNYSRIEGTRAERAAYKDADQIGWFVIFRIILAGFGFDGFLPIRSCP